MQTVWPVAGLTDNNNLRLAVAKTTTFNSFDDQLARQLSCSRFAVKVFIVLNQHCSNYTQLPPHTRVNTI